MASKKVALIAGVVVLAAGGTALGIEIAKNTKQVDEKTNTNNTSSAAEAKSYTADSSYTSPAGVEKVSLTMSIREGVVESSDFSVETNSSTSKEYIGAFSGAYKEQVVGKKVSEINLSRIAGASLTTDGFNNALAIIESQISE